MSQLGKKFGPRRRSKYNKYHQGYFRPKNPQKYVGDPNYIVYRSSWELRIMRFLDNNPKVIRWASEFPIRYRHPDGFIRNYYVDFYVELIDNGGNHRCYYIEVKPSKYVDPSRIEWLEDKIKKSRGKTRARYMKELETLLTNISKVVSAKKHAQARGCQFIIITEHTDIIQLINNKNTKHG